MILVVAEKPSAGKDIARILSRKIYTTIYSTNTPFWGVF